MKVDFSQKMHALNGDVLLDDSQGEVTLGQVCALSLAHHDRDRSMEDTLRAGNLSRDCYGGGVMDLTAKQVSLIQDHVLKYVTQTFLAAEAHAMLEAPESDEIEAKG